MKPAQTFVIFPFFTRAAFLGAIVRAPFFVCATFGRLPDLAVPAAGLDLIAPCAIVLITSVQWFVGPLGRFWRVVWFAGWKCFPGVVEFGGMIFGAAASAASVLLFKTL